MTASDWISVAALVVAFGVGFATAVLLHRQNRLQKRLTSIEEARYRSEREPQIKVSWTGSGLLVKSKGPEDYDEVTFEVRGSSRPLSQIEGDALPGRARGLVGSWGAMRRGESKTLSVEGVQGGRLSLLLVATNGNGTWDTLASCDIPSPPQVIAL